MRNLLKEKIDANENVVGTFLELGCTAMVDCLALGGFDYIIIDTEHGPFETESVSEYILAAKGRGVTPFVRAKDASRPAILKNLDAGAMGVIIPNIRSVDEVLEIVKYGKYHPLGERGVAFGRGCGYGMEKRQTLPEYFIESNRETMIIPQCETVGCLENIEAIAAIEGVDGIFVGPYDLSSSMGKPGQFSDSELISAIARILAACKAAQKPCFIYTDTPAKAKAYFEQGFEAVTLGMDAILIISAFRKLISQIGGDGSEL